MAAMISWVVLSNSYTKLVSEITCYGGTIEKGVHRKKNAAKHTMIWQQALRSQGAYRKGGDVWWLLVSFKERFIDTIQRKLLVWLIVGGGAE
jgi:hypothetical protein